MTARLVSAVCTHHLYYCNAILANLPGSTLAPLQRLRNAAARLVMNLGPRDHVTPALYVLHWLSIRSRIQFSLCILVHQVIGGRSPPYFSELVTPVAALGGQTSQVKSIPFYCKHQ